MNKNNSLKFQGIIFSVDNFGIVFNEGSYLGTYWNIVNSK